MTDKAENDQAAAPELAPELRLQVEELAELQFDPAQIAVILELPQEVAELPEVAHAYKVGTLRGEAEIRRAIKRMAKQGSGPAQTQYLAMIKDRQRREAAKERPANVTRKRGRRK